MARIFTKGDNRFSIDDAFQEEMDEIKNYNNSTSEKSPLKPKSLTNSSIALNAEDCVVNLDNVPSSQTLNMNGVNNIMSNNIISYNILHNNQYKSKYDDSLSRDSDSYIHNYSNIFDDSSWCCTHPKVKENWKLVLGAALLFFIGTGLIVSGVVAVFTDGISVLQGVVFFVVGAICFIPGAYHIVYIYLAVKGLQGYDFYHLPLYIVHNHNHLMN
ncbi:hypothetical protein M8J76_015335 [Diaphorina citri]|nr:hypothetical protein M8J76_015335 [Diaphorina citri]